MQQRPSSENEGDAATMFNMDVPLKQITDHLKDLITCPSIHSPPCPPPHLKHPSHVKVVQMINSIPPLLPILSHNHPQVYAQS